MFSQKHQHERCVFVSSRGLPLCAVLDHELRPRVCMLSKESTYIPGIALSQTHARAHIWR